jgi:hypothetical protein
MATTFGANNHRKQYSNPLPEGIYPVTKLFQNAGYNTFIENKCDFNFDYTRKELNTVSSREELFSAKKPWFMQMQLRGGKGGIRFLKRKENKPQIDADKITVPPYYPDNDFFKQMIIKHYMNIAGTDIQVGEIIEQLKKAGQLENTVVFFLSDHGAPGLPRDKQFCYEGGIRVPLLIRWPESLRKTPGGTVRNDLAGGIDIAPTSLALAGIPIPKYMEGKDLFAPDYKERDYVISARDRCDFSIDRIRAVIGKRFKYIKNYLPDRPYMQLGYRDFHGKTPTTELKRLYKEGKLNKVQSLFAGNEKPAEELYDLQQDPYEINNLASNSEYKEELEKNRKILKNWIKSTGDKNINGETADQLAAVIKRWGDDKCINPEYEKARKKYPDLKGIKALSLKNKK